jgi:hypothetical protein
MWPGTVAVITIENLHQWITTKHYRVLEVSGKESREARMEGFIVNSKVAA